MGGDNYREMNKLRDLGTIAWGAWLLLERSKFRGLILIKMNDL